MIFVRDTTLREGIQVPGMNFSFREQKQIVKSLYKAGIRFMEVGLPNDPLPCKPIAEYIHNKYKDISVSGIIQLTRENFLEKIKLSKGILDEIDLLLYSPNKNNINWFYDHMENAAAAAKKLGVKYSFGVMNAVETPMEILEAVVKKSEILDGRRFIFYDSKGIGTAINIYFKIKQLVSNSSIFMHFHGHNDFGQSLSNAVAGIQAGAKYLDASIMGLGCRAGNISLEKLLFVVSRQLGLQQKYSLEELNDLVAYIRDISGITDENIKPFSGDLINIETSVAHMLNPNQFRDDIGVNQLRFAFSLPVDYREAIEHFCEKAGIYKHSVNIKRVESALRKATDNTKGVGRFVYGLSFDEICKIIAKESSK